MLALSYKRSVWIRVTNPPTDDTTNCFPDLSDPATIGCLLALTREAHNDAGLSVCKVGPLTWEIYFNDTEYHWAESEAEVLVLVLNLEVFP